MVPGRAPPRPTIDGRGRDRLVGRSRDRLFGRGRDRLEGCGRDRLLVVGRRRDRLVGCGRECLDGRGRDRLIGRRRDRLERHNDWIFYNDGTIGLATVTTNDHDWLPASRKYPTFRSEHGSEHLNAEHLYLNIAQCSELTTEMIIGSLG